MDSEKERYYRVLNLEPGASPEEIYRVYRDLVRIWDPQRFVTQPHLELMAEGKLKEIIEAYNALTSSTEDPKPAPPPAPAAAEIPQLLTPVPDHVADRNLPNPVFTPAAPVTPPPAPVDEEPAVPRPLSAWEMERPASYPEAAAPKGPPKIQFAPPPAPTPPPRVDPWKLMAQFSAFLIPVVLAGMGLYLYSSGSSRTERQDASLPLPASVKTHAAPAGDAAASHHVAKKSSQPEAPEAAAAPIVLPNGAQLMPPLGRTGAGRFRIANRSGQDAVVRVQSQAAPGVPLRMVYVQPDTEVPIEGIATGVYTVSISLGPLTRAPRKFAPPLGPFQFMQIESVDGPQSDDYQLVLKPSQ